ncbi:hypothetical protein GCM10010349_01720 [Streptomyces flavofungini]|nr:hypothetical protein GCM10010349_01720 [Streptomyces flavofungini]
MIESARDVRFPGKTAGEMARPVRFESRPPHHPARVQKRSDLAFSDPGPMLSAGVACCRDPASAGRSAVIDSLV